MSHSNLHTNLNAKSCAVIGAGIAGIAAAIRMAHRGYKVEVYDRQASPGGKISELYADGFRFDMGPTVLTLPHLIDELFELCDRNPTDYFNYIRIERPFKYFYEDGSSITAYSDLQKFASEIENKSMDSGDSFFRYLKNVANKFDILNEVFIENSLHVAENYLTKKALSGMLKFRQIDIFKTINQGNRQYFKDPKIIQIFNKCANYVGSNPFQAPGTLNVIQHLEINLGVYFPVGGMYDIVKGLVRLAEELGVTFHYNQLIEEVVVQDKVAVGIRFDEKPMKPYDRIISNMDVFHTYRRLMPKEPEPTFSLKQPKSSSCVAFYWGIDREFEELELHNMLFTHDEKMESESIFKIKEVYDDPSIYLANTSHVNPSDAPPGCQNWFVMVSAPNNQGQDWDKIKMRTRANIIDKLNRVLKTDIEKHIRFEHILTPPMIESRYLSLFGAPYGTSSNKRLSAFLRHPNFSSKIKNLYFVGGTVHPGAGVPMSLNSAKVMDKVFK